MLFAWVILARYPLFALDSTWVHPSIRGAASVRRRYLHEEREKNDETDSLLYNQFKGVQSRTESFICTLKKQRFVFRPMRTFLSTNMVRTSVQGYLCMRKQNTKRAVPLDAVPERCTKRCPPRFQAGSERNFGP